MEDYLLVVTTHGNSSMLSRTLRSFEEHVLPQPADAVLIEDGPPRPVEWWTGRRVSLGATLGRQGGFCEAVKAGWAEVARSELPYVFWLEHDFIFLRDVTLDPVAAVLDRNLHVAQMSFMRQTANADERDRGGPLGGHTTQLCDDFLTGSRWVEHEAYWTTNPSLFRTQLARDVDWPGEPECEGKMGVELKAQGFHFGVWGNGEPWVNHVGHRDGSGRGY